MIELDKIKALKEELSKAIGKSDKNMGDYELIAPTMQLPKRKKVGEIFGMDIIADPLCPPDSWFLAEKEVKPL